MNIGVCTDGAMGKLRIQDFWSGILWRFGNIN